MTITLRSGVTSYIVDRNQSFIYKSVIEILLAFY